MADLVIYDPDAYEMAETTTIGIFEPGSTIEREITSDHLVSVLGNVVLGFILMTVFTVFLVLPLFVFGMITVNLYTFEVQFKPGTLAIILFGELGLVIPPLRYIRKRNLPLSAIGIKVSRISRAILIGLGMGIVMITVNIVMTYFLSGFGPPSESSMFNEITTLDVIAASAVMFIIVGPVEEILFRGFLQRRVEMFYRRSSSRFQMKALIVTSFLFAVFHLDVFGLITRFVLGLLLGYLAQRENYSVVAPSIAHGFNNAMVFVLAFFGF